MGGGSPVLVSGRKREMDPRSPKEIRKWKRYVPNGGGAFPGEICEEWEGLPIRDVVDERGGRFKTEFNLETMTYQFYSVCNEGVLSRFVQKGGEFLFPVGHRVHNHILGGRIPWSGG